ncbi:MAG TPA: hypothetical protein VFT74_15465 [Isosphaeraceae bacterium]|nr:hypothetical protein [Isosphaeraceae bacterium]
MSEAFHILLSIPDDDETRTFLRDLFQKAQADVEDAPSEVELLEKVRSQPDLIVLGSRWVRPSAPELSLRLKSLEETRHSTVACLTEGAEPEGSIRSENETLSLPVDPAKVLRLLTRIVANSRTDDHQRVTWSRLFDQIDDGIGLMDGSGTLLLGNRALWEKLGVAESRDLRKTIEEVSGGWPPAGQTWPVSRALRLRRRQVLEWSRGDRWFRISLDPLPSETQGDQELLLLIVDVTEDRNLRSQIAESEAARLASETRIQALERDARLLLKFSEPDRTPTPDGPLRTRDSALFCDAVAEYETLLEWMVDQRNYQVEHQQEISRSLRHLSERLGRAQAGPRDVIEIHGTSLRRSAQEQNASRSRLYFEEGRLLVLELMGHVLSYYRGRQSKSEDTPGASGSLRAGEARKAN